MGNVDSLYHSGNVHNEKSAKENTAGEKTKISRKDAKVRQTVRIAAKRRKKQRPFQELAFPGKTLFRGRRDDHTGSL
jgi:hypothetical protein